MRLKLKLSFIMAVLAFGNILAKGQLPYKQVIAQYSHFLIAQDSTPVDSLKQWYDSLSPAGTWATVNYNDKNSSSWKATEHLNRIVKLSIAYHNPSSPYFHQQPLWEKISLATTHWFEKKYQNSNWWYNEIGVPQYWRDIVTLNLGLFTVSQRSEALGILNQYKIRDNFTGANLVWSADLALHYGIFTENEPLVSKGSKLIINEIKISSGEGIRPDYSYHQHGARLQTHHYGAAFLTENIRLAYELQNSPWSFPEAKMAILNDFLVQGWQWMARGTYISPATVDRAVSRINFLEKDLIKLLPYLLKLYPKGQGQLQQILNSQKDGKYRLYGYRYYPYSDVAAFQNKGFTLILKTISTRTEVTEHINGENQKGTFLNLGNTYLIRNGKEYTDLMPVWDWANLPGTTNFKGATTINRQSFVGGVSSGESGVAVMDFETSNAQSKLTGSKFWVMHYGQLFCLIADIKLTGATDSIFTTLEQSRVQGKVVGAADWVHHNGFTYVPLTGGKLEASEKKVTGSWSTLSKSGSSLPISENVFKVVLNHVNNSSAAYLIDGVVPIKRIQPLLDKPHWKVLKNTGDCQAMAFKDGTAMLSFHQKGELQVEKKRIGVSKACVLLITRNSIHVSDPSHTGGNIEISLNGKKIILTLPANGTAVKYNYK